MKIFKVPVEIIYNEILDYFEDNHNMVILREVCKEFKQICTNNGFIREICISSYNCPYWWIQPEQKGLKVINLQGITKPQEWIYFPWKKTMNFRYCLFGNSLIDPLESPETENINIDGILGGKGNYAILKINWKKFPNLKNISIKTQDFSFEGLENCRELKYIYVECTKIKQNSLPSIISKLPKLEHIVTNFRTDERLHFLSPFLKVCLIEKKYPCTSNSVIVPNRHLNDVNFNWHPIF
tara:strand:- start:6582 stop:7298 length:717 start_codon:yes stop_codon:yes gene_type:complete